MTTFDDREARFENEFLNDAKVRFRCEARRNKLLGLWAAEKLGMSGGDAEAYAGAVVQSDLEEAGEEDVFRKVRGDLDSASEKVTDEEIRAQMAALMVEAKKQIMEG